MTYYSRRLRSSFAHVIESLASTLAHQGFAIVTRMDLHDKFKSKLNINFRNYTILGACNPELAYEAISLDSHIGTLLPCNILVQEHENGEVEVSAMNPLANLGPDLATSQLKALAEDIGSRLRAAIDGLDHPVATDYGDHFPEGAFQGR